MIPYCSSFYLNSKPTPFFRYYHGCNHFYFPEIHVNFIFFFHQAEKNAHEIVQAARACKYYPFNYRQIFGDNVLT